MARFGGAFFKPLVLTVLAFTTLACSQQSVTPEQESAHVSDVTKGSIGHYGAEVKLSVGTDKYTTVTFPAEVRYTYARQAGPLQIAKSAKDSKSLLIKTKPGLSNQGELVRVLVIDGHWYHLRVLPNTAEVRTDQTVQVDLPNDSRIIKPEAALPNSKTSKRIPSEAERLLAALKLAGSQGDLAGYDRSFERVGKVVVNDSKLRAAVEVIYKGPGLWGYVLEVENLTHTEQALVPDKFKKPGVILIGFSHSSLEPRASRLGQEQQKPVNAKAYIVAEPDTL